MKYALCVAGPADGETATLNVSSDLDGSTVSGSGGELRSVQVRTVDSLIDEYSLPGPYLLKFDTHGYELPILKGAVKALSHTEVIIMECYNFRFVSQAKLFYEMCVHMEALGFRPYDMAAPMLRKHDKALWQMDLFFARQEHAMFEVNSYA